MLYDLDAEKEILGCILKDNNTLDEINLIPDDFYRSEYKAIYQIILDLRKENKPADLTLVSSKFGKVAFVAEILRETITTDNIKHYADIVKQKYIARQAINHMQRAINLLHNGEPPAGLITNAELELAKLTETTQTNAINIKQLIPQAIKSIEGRKNKNGITGITSGITYLDKYTAGFQNSDFIIVAARPSMGKTAFALHISKSCNKKVAIFSLEMSKESLTERMITTESRLNGQKIRLGQLTAEDWTTLSNGAGRLYNKTIYIDDTSLINPMEVKAKARKIQREDGLDMIIIDYLQLMSWTQKTDSKQREVSEISRALKGIAKDLNIPVIALSQLSRSVEQRDNKRPRMSDLRESGAIEQDADLIIFLYRDEYYNKDTDKKGIVEAIIGKQRNGPVGEVEMKWKPETGEFIDTFFKSNGKPQRFI